MASPRTRARLFPVLVLLGAWAYLPWLGSPVLLDDPNDGQYAEVAREMVETGEWISPQLDYVLFLNKPPLLYWLIALSFKLIGVNEFAARLPSALAAMVLLLLTWRLGTALWGSSGGWWSAAVLLTTGSLMVEAQHVRPDLLLSTAIVGAMLAATRLAQGSCSQTNLFGLQVALAAGLLAKGIVGLLLPAAAVAAAMLASRNVLLFRTLTRVTSWWWFALLVLPWHLLAAWRHPGFAWDYIVNQHFLFFLDLKLPRDSEGIPLAQFWMAFAMRLFPWTFFLPFAVVHCWQRRGREYNEQAWGTGLLSGLVVGVLALFSAAPSRLEHYSIPALPACALLIGTMLDRTDPQADRKQLAVLAVHILPLACLGLAAPWAVPRVITSQNWLANVPGLEELGRAAGLVFACGSTLALLLLIFPVARRRALLALIATMVALSPAVQHGLALMAPFNSSAPAAAVVNALASQSDTLVYEAPMEYQSGAGLCFYTGRKWEMLRPEGFVPPPYLVPHENELFIDRADLLRRWSEERIFFVSNSLVVRSSMEGVIPEPFWVVSRSGDRWIVSSRRP